MKIKIQNYTLFSFILFANLAYCQYNSHIARDSINYPILRKQLIEVTEKIKTDSINCKLYFERNLLNFELLNLQDSKADLTKAIKLCPKDSIVYFYYYQRGSLNDKLGLIQEAFNDFSKSIELKQNFAQGYLDRGTLLTNANYFKEAEKDIDLAIELKPKWADAYFIKGTNYDFSNDKEKAVLFYQKSIEYKSEDDKFIHKAYNNIGIILMQDKRYLEAIEYFNSALDIENKYSLALINRGNCKLKLENKKGACEDFKKAILFGRSDLTKEYENICE